MPFTGFQPEAQAFLRDLAQNNSRDWFEANRDRYTTHILEASKAFVAALAPHLRTFAPHIETQARVNGSIFRMNRDLRFSNDKTPYKTHVDFWFWEGRRRTAVSGFFLRITANQIGIGAGCHGFDNAALARYRHAVGGDPEFLQLVTDIEASGHALQGASLKRLPRGHAEAPPATHRFLMHKALYISEYHDPPPSFRTESFVLWCAAKWIPMSPLHAWLADRVQPAA